VTKPLIKLAYTDFWPGFDQETDYFTRMIRQRYDIEWSDQPDFVIYSVFGFDYLRYSCIRIFYTGENVRPDFRDCDYAFSFDYSERPEQYRLPYYARRISEVNLEEPVPDAEAELARKTRFCTFVYSDPAGVQRNRIFKKLTQYKRVDSGGGYLNNIGGRVADKLAFLRQGKFTIAFEHSSFAGYTTEKITDAFMARTLPIYWGNPLIDRDFNPGCFINAHDFSTDDALLERIIELDRDDAQYLSIMRQPVIPMGGNPFIHDDNILDHWDRIFTTPKIPVSVRRARLHHWDRSVRPLFRRTRSRLKQEYRKMAQYIQNRQSGCTGMPQS